MWKLYLLMVVIVLLSAGQTSAQTALSALYLLITSDTEYNIGRYDPTNAASTILFSVPTSTQGVLTNVFPSGEVEALNAYLPTYNNTTGARYPITSLSVLWTDAHIESIIVSPDNQQVIAKVVYQTCFVPQNPVCFGTTQLVLIDAASNQRVLLNLGMHDFQFLPHPVFLPHPETGIFSIEWTPDQQSLIISVTDHESSMNFTDRSIVVLPLSGAAPFKIGEGNSWAVAPTGNQIVALSYFRPGESGITNDTFYVINFDIQTRQSSQTWYSLRGYFVYERAGLAFDGRYVVFQRALDSLTFNDALGNNGGGLARFDPQTGEAVMLLPEQFFRRIQSTPTGTRLILQTTEDQLVEGILHDDTITVFPLIRTPVSNWSLSASGALVVQLAGESAYQFFESEGTSRQPFTSTVILRQGIQSPEASRILAFDW